MNEKDRHCPPSALTSSVGRINGLEDLAAAVWAFVEVGRQPLVKIGLFAAFVGVWALVFLSIFR